MVQPDLGDITEIDLVYIDGSYSHALSRHVPLPAAGDREVFYLDEELGAAEATSPTARSPNGRSRARRTNCSTAASTWSTARCSSWRSRSPRSISVSAHAAAAAFRRRHRDQTLKSA